MQPIKILHIIHGLNLGGAENFIYNVLSHINHKEFVFDFAIQNPHIGHKKFKDLIEASGGRIFMIPDFRRNPIGQAKALKNILKNGYKCVHIHMNSFINPIPAIVAHREKVPVVIHSHNTHNGQGGAVGKLVHKMNCMLFMKRAFKRIACGPEAGQWMFGNKDFTMLSNAVDVDKFACNQAARSQIRSKYGIENATVIGHMGRFVPEKNQTFLLDLLAHLRKNNPERNWHLLLCGDGPLRLQVEEKVRTLGLTEHVTFTGAIDNPEDYYSAFDCFVLPSWFEGLAFVAIEAQAAGLAVVASDTNTSALKITDSVSFISLDDSLSTWGGGDLRIA